MCRFFVVSNIVSRLGLGVRVVAMVRFRVRFCVSVLLWFLTLYLY